MTTAAEHRRRVATRLFGLHDEMRYSNLLHLLRRLRDPNIGNRIEAGELAAVLRDALPPPSGEALEKAADRFDTLDQVREQLARTERTAAALARFLDTYRSYARGVLGERCQSVILPLPSTDGPYATPSGWPARRKPPSAPKRRRTQRSSVSLRTRAGRGSSSRGSRPARRTRTTCISTTGGAPSRPSSRTARIGRQSAEAACRAARHAADDVERAEARAAVAERRINNGRAVLLRLAREAGIDQAVVPRRPAPLLRRWPLPMAGVAPRLRCG